MKENYKILVINIGSTSTKIAIYEDNLPIIEQVFRHSNNTLDTLLTIEDQYSFRKKIILDFITENGIILESLHGIVGRGGLLKPIEGGTYIVNDQMVEDLKIGKWGQHPVNLSGIISAEIGDKHNIPVFMVDPIVVDELDDIARVSGHPLIERISVFHALNQKAVARRIAKELDMAYEELNLIVAHIGGGVTIGAHRRGKVIDVNNALDGDGPFSAERSGGLPFGKLIKLCYSEKYSYEELRKILTSKSGLIAYLGTNDGREVAKMVESGDKNAKLVYEAMAYQISKEIASCAAVLNGNVDAIILTGGFCYDTMFVKWIVERVKFIANVKVVPGEDEMMAMVEGAIRILTGEEEAKIYK